MNIIVTLQKDSKIMLIYIGCSTDRHFSSEWMNEFYASDNMDLCRQKVKKEILELKSIF